MVHGNSLATCLVAMLPSSSVGNTLPISKFQSRLTIASTRTE